ncbi:MAG: hypothetical protein ACI4RH_12400 [Huintestinicola sp.]
MKDGECMSEELICRFDKIIESRKGAIKYAEEHYDELRAKEQNADKQVITSLGYDLGIACPSPLIHKVIRGNKKGRILKAVPEDKEKSYELVSYINGKPVSFRHYSKFGTYSAYYFFEYDGLEWAVDLYDDKGKATTLDVFCWKYEGDRLDFFYKISGISLIAEQYCYAPSGEASCNWYHYIQPLYKSLPQYATGNENCQLYEYYYEITDDNTIKCYEEKKNGEFIYTGDILSSKRKSSASPVPEKDTEEKFFLWLDSAVKEPPEGAKAAYFCLYDCSDIGFDIELFYTVRFDPDDDEWACEYFFENGEPVSEGRFSVVTNGAMEYEKQLAYCKKLIKGYLKNGERRELFSALEGVGTGFSDGDVFLLKIPRAKRAPKQ